jgi:hypothetical protein
MKKLISHWLNFCKSEYWGLLLNYAFMSKKSKFYYNWAKKQGTVQKWHCTKMALYMNFKVYFAFMAVTYYVRSTKIQKKLRWFHGNNCSVRLSFRCRRYWTKMVRFICALRWAKLQKRHSVTLYVYCLSSSCVHQLLSTSECWSRPFLIYTLTCS